MPDARSAAQRMEDLFSGSTDAGWKGERRIKPPQKGGGNLREINNEGKSPRIRKGNSRVQPRLEEKEKEERKAHVSLECFVHNLV